MIVTGSESASCGCAEAPASGLRENFLETDIAEGASGQFCAMPSRNVVVATTDQRRRTILHHGDQLCGRLPGVERNHDQTFRHDGQIERNPVNAVVGQQGAAVAFLQTSLHEKRASLAPRESSVRDR